MRKMMSLGLALVVVALAATMPANAQSETGRGSQSLTPAPTGSREIAKSLIARGLTVKAAQEMHAVLASGQGTTDDYTMYGDAVRYSGDFRSAIQAYTYALRMVPMNTQALGGLAMAYAQGGQSARGLEVVRVGLSQTSDPQARKFLAATMASIQSMNNSIATTTNHVRG
jgi:cytochrome c-type biogenesis protein CcmH/NrfG